MDKTNKQRIEELEQTIKKAQEQIEEIKLEESAPKIKYPNVNDILWCLTACGDITRYRWDNSPLDRKRFEQGNLFYTYEEAEFERERRKVIEELKLFAEPKNKVWDKAKPHYYIEFNYNQNFVEFDYIYTYKHSDIYFASEEEGKKAVDFVGADRVAKYYLGV